MNVTAFTLFMLRVLWLSLIELVNEASSVRIYLSCLTPAFTCPKDPKAPIIRWLHTFPGAGQVYCVVRNAGKHGQACLALDRPKTNYTDVLASNCGDQQT